jgi:hypothetical protein
MSMPSSLPLLQYLLLLSLLLLSLLLQLRHCRYPQPSQERAAVTTPEPATTTTMKTKKMKKMKMSARSQDLLRRLRLL